MKFIRKKIIENWEKVAVSDAERIAKQTPTPNVTVRRKIPYNDDGHEMHTLNVYYPDNAKGLLPTVVDIHGGGWLYGDRELNRHFCMFLAAQGYTVIGMSYRLLPEPDLKGQVQDIFESLHWLSRHAKDYHSDLDRVFLTGDSAGGHLSGLTACANLSADLQKTYGVKPVSFPFRAVAINHGVCDIHASFYKGKSLTGKLVKREMALMFFGKRPSLSPFYKKSSLKDTALGITLPSVLIISSEHDALHDGQSVALHVWMTAQNIPHETLFWEKEKGGHLTHVFNITHPEYAESIETNLKMLDFFKRSLH